MGGGVAAQQIAVAGPMVSGPHGGDIVDPVEGPGLRDVFEDAAQVRVSRFVCDAFRFCSGRSWLWADAMTLGGLLSVALPGPPAVRAAPAAAVVQCLFLLPGGQYLALGPCHNGRVRRPDGAFRNAWLMPPGR
ncbi:hypothetical protein HEK131_30230 [Streptomyces seoulensis]|nr:hypothetical protein HEK131_30230 [Streptomyces seoulensis]